MARPASTSCCIEVRKAPSLRVTAWRSSGVCATAQPMRAPIAAASCIAAVQKASTSGSAMMRSTLAPVIADTGFIVMLPHSLYQMSWRTFGRQRGVETGVAQQLGQALHPRRFAADRLADDQPLAHAVLHQAGLGRGGAGMHHAADHLRERNQRGRCAPPGSTLCSGSSPNAGAPCANHQGTPFIAGSTTVSRPSSGADARAPPRPAPGP